jgi:hypothetical protein
MSLVVKEAGILGSSALKYRVMGIGTAPGAVFVPYYSSAK